MIVTTVWMPSQFKMLHCGTYVLTVINRYAMFRHGTYPESHQPAHCGLAHRELQREVSEHVCPRAITPCFPNEMMYLRLFVVIENMAVRIECEFCTRRRGLFQSLS